jgi:hypothetical protein
MHDTIIVGKEACAMLKGLKLAWASDVRFGHELL